MSTGYTLPVFACASAIAALRHLQECSSSQVDINLINPDRQVTIEIEQVAKIDDYSAIAITRSDPGDHLDLTRNTPIWAKVSFDSAADPSSIILQGGEGIGIQQGRSAIYNYARKLITANLKPLLDGKGIVVTIILPEGIRLAKRTSNEAFGVERGLSLLGTTGIVQPLTAPEQLAEYQSQIVERATKFDTLVFCIGENGIDLAQKSGIDPQQIIKTANWIGAMLVTAATAGIESILLFGYHGKLIKLAGGIFHTHNHLADGRLEIMTAYCALQGLSTAQLESIFSSPTTESALDTLRQIERDNPDLALVDSVYSKLSLAIDRKCQDYIFKYSEKKLCIGCVLFDRSRKVIYQSKNAALLLDKLC